MEKAFKVEIKGKKPNYIFKKKEDAEAYAITATAWVGGKYRITQVFVTEEGEVA